jgi:hypothetical protein
VVSASAWPSSAWFFQDGGIAKAPKRQMPVGNFSLKSLGGSVVKSDAGLASAIQFKADKS